MSDASFPNELEAASAAADGVAVPGADAQLVTAIGDVRAELSAVPVVADDVRERAIAAALAAFDAGTAGVVAPPATPIRLDGRRRRYRLLVPLAAAAAVAAIAIAALADRTGEDRQATTATSAAASAAEQVTDRNAGAGAATTAAAATAAAAAPTPVASGAPAGVLNGPAYVLPQIADEDQLRQFAVAADRKVAGEVTSAAEPTTTVPVLIATCDLTGFEVLGDVSYQGRPAIVVRVSATGAYRAIGVPECDTLVEISPGP